MQIKPSRMPNPFDEPAFFEISVLGVIDSSWSDRLEGMQITQTKMESGALVTTMDGQLSDQAALAGVLNTLYDLHLTLLSVKCLDF